MCAGFSKLLSVDSAVNAYLTLIGAGKGKRDEQQDWRPHLSHIISGTSRPFNSYFPIRPLAKGQPFIYTHLHLYMYWTVNVVGRNTHNITNVEWSGSLRYVLEC